MYKYKYTLMNRGQPVVQTDNIEFARDGVRELGQKSYVRYNERAIETFIEDKHWETPDVS